MPRSQQRRKELLAAEEDEHRWVAYNAVVAERDKLAEEITREYPPIVDKLVDLVTRLAANAQTTNSARSATGMPRRRVRRSFARPRK